MLTEFEFREAITALYAQTSQDSAMDFALVSAFQNLQGAASLTERFNEAGFTFAANTDSASVLFISYAYPALLVLGVLAAFYFMRSVRHPETE